MPVVYFVDDQVEILEVFGEILSAEFKIEIFNNPENLVLRVAEGDQPRVVISDVNMPQMKGVDLAEKLHRLNPSIRVILLSGAVDKDLSIQACNMGVFSIIEKPINPQVLIETVKRAVESNILNERMELFRKKATDFVTEAAELLQVYKNRAQDAEAMLKDLGLLPQNPTDANSKLLEISQLQVKVQSLRKELRNFEAETQQPTQPLKLTSGNVLKPAC